MKISVIGTGKTGSRVVEMLGDRLHYAFDEENPATVKQLSESDGVIIFVPGDAVPEILETVLESEIPAAWGSTGFEWPGDLQERLKEKEQRWVTATNFSLGMNVIRHTIQTLSENAEALKDPSYQIHEIHHVHKKDAPSGTALSWKEWLGKQVTVSSDRKGDINGIHELSIETEFEKITLKHEALDRSIFAEGAIWAIEQLIRNKHLEVGIHTFGELFDRQMETR